LLNFCDGLVRREAAFAVSNSAIVDFEGNPADKGAQTVTS
jgi:hypothetical protein